MNRYRQNIFDNSKEVLTNQNQSNPLIYKKDLEPLWIQGKISNSEYCDLLRLTTDDELPRKFLLLMKENKILLNG